MTAVERPASKVPEVTLIFWIMKIAATTLGETGGDTFTMTLDLGYLVGTAIFFSLLVILVGWQIAAKKFHPLLYWATIVASTTAGTTLADFADRSLRVGYAGGAAILLACLMIVLAAWYWSLGSISVATVATPKVESFYWTAITFSQTLGPALGELDRRRYLARLQRRRAAVCGRARGARRHLLLDQCLAGIFILGRVHSDAAIGRDRRRFSRQAR